MRAVLVEPNPLIAEALGRQLGMGKIRYDRLDWPELEELLAEQGGEALGFDAIVLGGLPDPAAAVASLRAQRVTAAVLCLLERRDVAATVALLHAGADDVLVKPVVSAEVRARIEVARRRARGLVSNAVRVGRLTVFLDGRDPNVGGERLRLSQREHAILGVLAAHHRRVVSKEHIYDEVYGLSGADPLDKVIDVYICKLRKKIAEATGGARYIETVYGRGYKFEAPPEHEEPDTPPRLLRAVTPFKGLVRPPSAPIAAVG
ncbi:response regulator transcription factor [Azospirillum canadense]|uniref:response regulator transcription factor n=1 Tax=Azospirillum canadense TaxID=403962 RepID=UPI002226F9F7|nr:response regulator transcription factor [Azospirillum canadense]MCW2239914.1 two-component system cell cycle response regulator CtrA [Azospirillum canadense]